MTRLLRGECEDGTTCPRVYRKDSATLIVNGAAVGDPDDLRRVRADGQADEEVAVYLPATLLPELAEHMDLAGLVAFIDEHFTSRMFRMEGLPAYNVPNGSGDLEAYLAGRESTKDKSAWLDRLRREAATGRHSRRLRLLHDPLPDYEACACEWGYTDNTAAGEDVRVLQLPPGGGYLDEVRDFYLIEDAYLLRMVYDAEGHFLGAVVGDETERRAHAALAELLWERAEPFTPWWAAHPEYHRASRLTV